MIVDKYDLYKIGITINEYNPAKESFKNMLHLVAYDIRSPKRLRKVANTCLNYGIRVEYSVFECDLAQHTFVKLWADLLKEIDEDEDTILVYKICGSCVSKIVSIGDVTRPGKPLFYMLDI